MWTQEVANKTKDCAPPKHGDLGLSRRQKCELSWVDGLAGSLVTTKIIHCGLQRSDHLRNVNLSEEKQCHR